MIKGNLIKRIKKKFKMYQILFLKIKNVRLVLISEIRLLKI